MKVKTYKTYNARNAVKAAQVTNHIKAQKKLGVSHEAAKADAHRIFNVKNTHSNKVRIMFEGTNHETAILI